MSHWRVVWVAAAIALSGCALLDQLPGRERPRPTALYSAAAGVALHRSPEAGSEVVGMLGRHEGVLRYQRENGFAYVTSEQTGRSGWVREGQLIERLPVAAKPAAPEPAAEPVNEPAPETAPEAEPPTPPEKSVFDPY